MCAAELPRSWHRFVTGVLIANVFACGTRTELFDGRLFEDNDDDTFDAGEPSDASTPNDARAPGDANAPNDSGPHHPPHDASVIEASVDAAPPQCNATSPTLLATPGYSVDEVTVDSSHVFFHDHSGIWRVSKTGGDATLLAAMEAFWWPDNVSFMLDDTDVSWMQILGGKEKTDVDRISKSGGTVRTLTTLNDYFYYGVPGAGSSIYTLTGTYTSAVLDSVAGDGTVTPLSSALPVWSSAAFYDGATLFLGGDTGIYRFDGTTFTTLVSLGPYLNGMVVDDTSVYYAVNALNGADPNVLTIYSVPKTGGTPLTLWSATNIEFGAMAVDAAHLYFVDRFKPAVMRMNKDGTSLTAVATTHLAESNLRRRRRRPMSLLDAHGRSHRREQRSHGAAKIKRFQ